LCNRPQTQYPQAPTVAHRWGFLFPIAANFAPFLIKKIIKKMEATKTVLTFTEASQYTGISKSYLYKLTSARKISHSKPSGKLIFFEKEELDKWLMSNKITPQQEIEDEAARYCSSNRKGGKK
jgi:excisionase family DNA binding protein